MAFVLVASLLVVAGWVCMSATAGRDPASPDPNPVNDSVPGNVFDNPYDPIENNDRPFDPDADGDAGDECPPDDAPGGGDGE